MVPTAVKLRKIDELASHGVAAVLDVVGEGVPLILPRGP